MTADTIHLNIERNASIDSGSISLTNTIKNKNVTFNLPEDLINGKYNTRIIIMDTGAVNTILPKQVGERLGIKERMHGYRIGRGIGGSSLSYKSPYSIDISLTDDDEKTIVQGINPYILEEYTPSVSCEARRLEKFQRDLRREGEDLSRQQAKFLCPWESDKTPYDVRFHTPTQKFPSSKIDRRLKLDINRGEDMNVILIGRDWQKEVDVSFTEKTLTITRNSPN